MVNSKLTKDFALNLLRRVPAENGFYFYNAIDTPINIAAYSLIEFLDKLKETEHASLEFHLSRGDFENWIRMLGDETLAKQIATQRQKELSGELLRKRLLALLRLRIGRLNRAANL